MLDAAVTWTPWLASASFVLAGVWLILQVVTVSEAAAVVACFETRAGPRAVNSQFVFVADDDVEAAQGLIAQARGPDAVVPPNAGGRLAAAVRAALGVMQQAELAGAVKPVGLPEVSCILMGGHPNTVEQLKAERDVWAAFDVAAVSG